MLKHAVGIVAQNRWNMTYNTLNSICYSQQDKSQYDLYIIDNGSSEEEYENLKVFLSSTFVSYKKLIRLGKKISLPEAWNLFLALSKDYDYRTKLDNDILFEGTSVANWNPPQRTFSAPPPPFEMTNPGGPPEVGPIVSAFNHSNVPKIKPSSKFLHEMENFMQKNKTHSVSMVPVPYGHQFLDAYMNVVNTKFMDYPCAPGNCMMISKEAFDKIGYFDERIPRLIDYEYTQRMMRKGLNVGIHDSHYVIHMGMNTPTDGGNVTNNIRTSKDILSKQGTLYYGDSIWSSIIVKIKDIINKNKNIVLN